MIIEEQCGAHSWHTQFKFMVTLGSFFISCIDLHSEISYGVCLSEK